jgi:hypothetical protein
MADAIDTLEIGRRVWTESGLHDHGYNKANVPPATGGTIVPRPSEPFGLELYTVKWDTGQESTHYASELKCIGTYRTLSEFHEALLANAVRVKMVVGPAGGLRKLRIYLPNGDWSQCASELKDRLMGLKIPIEVETLERKPRQTPSRL